MTTRSSYDLSDGIATITMDDGKVNALSVDMIGELQGQLDRAEQDEAVVVLTGRAKTFSAGFDLRTEPEGWPEMLVAGARLSERLLSFPRPTVIACNGNAIAMGGFTLLSADYRVGAAGDGRIGLNEVQIGMTIPWFGIEIARHRLARPYFDRCTVTGTFLGPDEALEAGFLDQVVAADALADAARAAATQLAGVKMDAHAATKLRIRERVLAGVRDGIVRIEDPERDF
jgi:enoyl-CoA hydratase/carnithine racemase